MKFNRIRIDKDEFIVQSCYYIDDVIRFNVGYVNKNIIIYESGTYYSFDDLFRLNNTEKLKKDRILIQNKINQQKEFIIKRIKELI